MEGSVPSGALIRATPCPALGVIGILFVGGLVSAVVFQVPITIPTSSRPSASRSSSPRQGSGRVWRWPWA